MRKAQTSSNKIFLYCLVTSTITSRVRISTEASSVFFARYRFMEIQMD